MGMGNTRMRDDRSADQDRTQSGNPNRAFNQPMMRDNRAMMPGGANKAPPQSFNHAVRPQLGPIRGGGPTQQQQMLAEQQQLMLQQQQRPQQPMPVDPRRMNFTRPYFRQ